MYWREHKKQGIAFCDNKIYALATWNNKTKQFHLSKNNDVGIEAIIMYATKKLAIEAGYHKNNIVKFGTYVAGCYAISHFQNSELTGEAWLETKLPENAYER